MKEFGECSDRTQDEIIGLIFTDKYISKEKQDKSKFNNLKDVTQKEIAELSLNYDSESAEEHIKDFVFENKFDGFRIFKITQFEAEQTKKQKQRIQNLQKQEQKQQKEREFTDSKLIKHSLGLKKAEGGLVSITIKEKNHPELKNQKDLIKTIKDNEQEYMKMEAEQQIKLLKEVVQLGYTIKLYE